MCDVLPEEGAGLRLFRNAEAFAEANQLQPVGAYPSEAFPQRIKDFLSGHRALRRAATPALGLGPG